MVQRRIPGTFPILLALALLSMPAGTAALAQESGSILGRLMGQTGQDARPGATVVRVRGSGSVPVRPDQAQLTVGVESRAPAAPDALTANSDALGAVLEALTAAGVPTASLRTGIFALQAAPAAPGAELGGQAAPASYSVVNTLSITTDDPADVGRLIDVAVGAGANQVHGVQFTVANPAAHRSAAVRAALLAASADATALAEALGGRVTRILEVSTLGGAGGEAAVLGAPPLLAGQSTVDATVELTLEIVGAKQPQQPTAIPPTRTPRATATATLTATATISPTGMIAGGATITATAASAGEADTRAGPAAAVRGPGAVPFVALAQADDGRYRGTRARAVVATSQTDWDRMAAPLLPSSLRLRPNYREETVVAIFLGQRPGAGYAVTVRELRVEDGVLTARVDATEPAGAVDRSGGPTSPYHILTLRKADLPAGVGEPLQVEVLPAR